MGLSLGRSSFKYTTPLVYADSSLVLTQIVFHRRNRSIQSAPQTSVCFPSTSHLPHLLLLANRPSCRSRSHLPWRSIRPHIYSLGSRGLSCREEQRKCACTYLRDIRDQFGESSLGWSSDYKNHERKETSGYVLVVTSGLSLFVWAMTLTGRHRNSGWKEEL